MPATVLALILLVVVAMLVLFSIAGARRRPGVLHARRHGYTGDAGHAAVFLDGGGGADCGADGSGGGGGGGGGSCD